jgi:hypothetical protein
MNTSSAMLKSNYIAAFGDFNLELKQDFEKWLQEEDDKLNDMNEVEEEFCVRNDLEEEVGLSDSNDIASSFSSSFSSSSSFSFSSSSSLPTIYKWNGDHIRYSSEDDDEEEDDSS